ncbi:hypothetical protein VTL71DRAFT_1173 [Oculimacula yallundae]|uniref:G domain-containing protein n=1 Tax=Oculimacula yallundae TaxID=86028 RepID=A0ABR4D2A0_9HELO
MDNLSIRRPAFGEIAAIGSLYDARNERFLSGSFFDRTLPIESVSETPIHTNTCDFTQNDTNEENFKATGVGHDFGASILAGLLSPKGAGRVLLEKRGSGQVLCAILHHRFLTIREKLDPTSPGVEGCRALSFVDNRDATHVVTEIEWGAQSAVMARTLSNADKSQFQAQFLAFSKAVGSQRPITRGNPAWMVEEGGEVDVTAFSDILDEEILMSQSQKFQEAYDFLALIPGHVKQENNGKGNPGTISTAYDLFYILLPISLLNVFLRVQTTENAVYCQPTQEFLAYLVRVFDKFDSARQKLNDYEVTVMAHRWCLPRTLTKSLGIQQQRLEDARTALQRRYARSLVEVRRGSSKMETLRTLLDEFTHGPSSPSEIVKTDGTQWAKLQFIDKMVQNGANYIGYNDLDLNTEIARRCDGTVYVLCFSSLARGNQQSWASNQALLLELLQRTTPKSYIAIFDCDSIGTRLEKAHIRHFEDGKEVTADLVESQDFLAGKCFARYSKVGLETEDVLKPVRRRFVKIPCPGRNCDQNEVCEWLCPECMAPIEFGYSDQFFYCDCGRNSFRNYDFKCNGSRHSVEGSSRGIQYEKYDPNVLNGLLQSLDQSNYQNILILGETGVGKSTFINAFVNYLTFDTLEEAKQHDDLTWVIPCSFSTQTMDRESPDGEIKETEIKVGSRSDENDGSKGASATQQTIVHSVETGTATIRLIDTPGIGDTRGIAYDKKNMADILQTLSNYDELHGILILLKSNSARLTISFIYCLKELLKHLHRSASSNMVFGFTNTRISNYTPGDTYGPLKTLLQQHPDVGLSLTTHTTYCFDSESFRYLAAYKNDVFLDNEEDFRRSWQHSRTEALRLVRNFNSKKPHAVNSTLSLNGAREQISELTKPMAGISQLIRANISLCADRERELGDQRLTGNKLRNRVQLQRIQLHPKTLDKPRTVCTAAACVEYKDDGNGNGTVVTNYITHCHPVCYLSDVRPDSIAHPGLRDCAAFSGEICRTSSCKHRWEQHQHVMYELVEKTATVTDVEIQKQLNANASDVVLRQTGIMTLKKLTQEYQEEHKKIQNAAAQFGMFLKQNSLSPVNDATIAYIDSLIVAETDKIEAGGNKIKLKALQADRAEYLETMAILTSNMSTDANLKPLDEAGVTALVKELYLLKHFGKNLQNVKDVTARAHQATYRERPHRLPRNSNASKSILHNIWTSGPQRQAQVGTHVPASRNSMQSRPQYSQSRVVVKLPPGSSSSSKGSSGIRAWFT